MLRPLARALGVWAVVVLATAASARGAGPAEVARAFKALSESGVQATAALSDDADLDFTNSATLLSQMLIPRAAGSANLSHVQDLLKRKFASLSTPWHVLEDRFDAATPYGPIPMTNLVFTHDPEAERKLVLAAHTDSKYFPSAPENTFVGATDSAAPCAIIVAVAEALTPWLDAKQAADLAARERGDRRPRTTLSIVLLDGEEAFKDWTADDSIYGAKCATGRAIPADGSGTSPRSGTSRSRRRAPLHARRTRCRRSRRSFCSICSARPVQSSGASSIRCIDMSAGRLTRQTGWMFDRLIVAEARLRSARLLWAGSEVSSLQQSASFFVPRQRETANQWAGSVEDDHLPFLAKGVPIMHLIPLPFPRVWHTLGVRRARDLRR